MSSVSHARCALDNGASTYTPRSPQTYTRVPRNDSYGTVPNTMATSKEFRLEDGKPVTLSMDRHAILDDPELDSLTLYEKKALLVNRELDAHGMGKYQWYIFFLCGFGYLIDLLYAQAFGLVAPALQQELGFGGWCVYRVRPA